MRNRLRGSFHAAVYGGSSCTSARRSAIAECSTDLACERTGSTDDGPSRGPSFFDYGRQVGLEVGNRWVRRG